MIRYFTTVARSPFCLITLFFLQASLTAGGCKETLGSLKFKTGVADGRTFLSPRYFVHANDFGVFYDPPDTATFVSAIRVLSDPETSTLVLGTGRGEDSFQAAELGQHVLGVDISPAAVDWARNHYARTNLQFEQFDFFNRGPADLLKLWPWPRKPTLLASNPPYVPCVSAAACPSPTMYGGPDGIRFVREVINYGRVLSIPKLALTIGSYSAPTEVIRYLNEKDYQVVHFSLTLTPFGKYSEANLPHLLELEKEGRAILWRPNPVGPPLGYFIVGISAIARKQVDYRGQTLSRNFLLNKLRELGRMSKEAIYASRFSDDQPVQLIRID